MPDGQAPRRLYWDACVFLSYVNQMPERLPDIEAFLEQARRREVQIVTSILSVGEVAFGAAEQNAHALDPDIATRIDNLWALGSPIQLVDVHLLIAERAKALRRAGVVQGWTGLRTADAMHLATAQHEQVDAVHTYDQQLERYGAVIGRPVGAPLAERPLLGLGD